MNLQNNAKIKHLYQLLPEGVLAPASWLTTEEYSPQLLYRYVQSGWLKKVGRGAYARADGKVEWQGAVLGLQQLAKLPFHVGGLSALNLQGFAHYLPIGGEKQIYLYGKENPPAWIKNIKQPQYFVFSKKPFFNSLGIKKLPTAIRDWELNVSGPERAILEMLYQVEKDGFEFGFAAEIFEGLTTLRPGLLNELLIACDNVRVKRIFLFLAHWCAHPWVKHLKVDEIIIGTGKLQVVKNGVFDKTYLITVPKEYSVR